VRSLGVAVAVGSMCAGSTPDAGGTTASSTIAFVRLGEHGRDDGEVYVTNADGRGQRNLTRPPRRRPCAVMVA
jgi:hypothetical protein